MGATRGMHGCRGGACWLGQGTVQYAELGPGESCPAFLFGRPGRPPEALICREQPSENPAISSPQIRLPGRTAVHCRAERLQAWGPERPSRVPGEDGYRNGLIRLTGGDGRALELSYSAGTAGPCSADVHPYRAYCTPSLCGPQFQQTGCHPNWLIDFARDVALATDGAELPRFVGRLQYGGVPSRQTSYGGDKCWGGPKAWRSAKLSRCWWLRRSGQLVSEPACEVPSHAWPYRRRSCAW